MDTSRRGFLKALGVLHAAGYSTGGYANMVMRSIPSRNIAPPAAHVDQSDEADWIKRSTAPGVFAVNHFNSVSELGADWSFNGGEISSGVPTPERFGYRSGSGPVVTPPSIDSSMRMTGAGSLRLTLASGSNDGGGGRWDTKFPDGAGGFRVFGENTEFWAQFRWRANDGMFQVISQTGGGGVKICDFGTGNLNPALVLQTLFSTGYPMLYTGGLGFRLEADDGVTTYPQHQCPYPPWVNPNLCFAFHPNVWYTFTFHLKVLAKRMQSPWNGNFFDAHHRMWVKPYGHPKRLVVDFGPDTTGYNVRAPFPCEGTQGYPRLILFPFTTNKGRHGAGNEHDLAHHWYDELILSTQEIAQPADSGQWTPPYSLPAPGKTLEIGANFTSDNRPPGWSRSNWQEPCYIGFGGGNFMEEYSEAGAYGLAGSGGHGEATLLGAEIFDFTTGRFEHIQPQGGLTHYRTNDYAIAELEGNGLWQGPSTPPSAVCFEIPGTGIPSCPHPYNDQVYLPPSMGGGPKGSLVYAHRAALGREGNQSAPMSHRFQLAAPGQQGQWTRFSNNVHQWAPYADVQTSAVLDRPNNRIWWIDGNSVSNLMYLDLADNLYKLSPSFRGTPQEVRSTGWCFYFKGLIIRQVVDLTTKLLALWAIDTTNIAAGWTKLRLQKPHVSTGIGNPFVFAPTTGKFYQMPWEGDNGVAAAGTPSAPYKNSRLRRITPPDAINKSVLLQHTWFCDTMTIDPPVPVPAPAGYSQKRFMYVPRIDCLAWIPGLVPGPQNWGWPVETRVFLIKPQ